MKQEKLREIIMQELETRVKKLEEETQKKIMRMEMKMERLETAVVATNKTIEGRTWNIAKVLAQLVNGGRIS